MARRVEGAKQFSEKIDVSFDRNRCLIIILAAIKEKINFRAENESAVSDVTSPPSHPPRRYKKRKFSWRAIGYSECNKSCGGGKREKLANVIYLGGENAV